MDTVLEIIQEIRPDVDFITCTTLIDDGVLDSFDIITIIAEIEENLDIAIPAWEIVPENFNSAEALQALVDRLDD
ncbi:MAG: acyl carrier protein [Clostridia bacterium]